MACETILNELEQLHDHRRASPDTSGATSVCVRAAKRKFRIVKRENNIPVLGICEYCNAEFTADPETIGRPQDAHAFVQKQFVAHECKRRTPANAEHTENRSETRPVYGTRKTRVMGIPIGFKP
jgi:hypothetical protein